jgi:hypothetical protein
MNSSLLTHHERLSELAKIDNFVPLVRQTTLKIRDILREAQPLGRMI